ncbi:MAG: zonular occludens toxin domain-containing protein [Clostridia bacterium]|nr:zonular occludens toxin domain-containing protein [Clostridia bacterium]
MFAIIDGDRGAGKTGLLIALANEAAFNFERNSLMRAEIRSRNKKGFNLTVPLHAVAVSPNLAEARFQKAFAYTRKPRIIDPLRLGNQMLAPEGLKCHYTLPYETIIIDEAQAYFYAKSKGLDKYQLDYFDRSRHNDLDIYMATTSAMRIHKDLRRLATFWHIKDRKVIYKRDGSAETRWEYDEYGPSETSVEDYNAGNIEFKKKVFTVPYDIFTLYNAKANRPMFILGHEDEDFDLNYPEDVDLQTPEDYKRYGANFINNRGE